MISRRKFLSNGLAATAGLPILLSHPLYLFQEGNAYINDMGLQLYTVRNQMAQDPQETLKAIHEAGYKQVEGGDVRAYAELLPKLRNAGLTSQSSFFPNAFITERWDLIEASGGEKPPASYTTDSIIEDAVKNDLKYLVFGYLRPEERQTLDDFKRVAEKLNQMGEQCTQADIHLCYHNHSFEFKPISGTVPYELLIRELDPRLVHFELDVFWASVGGYEPVPLMERLDGRIKLLHLKNKKKGTKVNYDERKVSKKAFQELNDGVLNIANILQTAEKVGVEQCFVEQDQSPDPMASIRQSMNYLQEIEENL